VKPSLPFLSDSKYTLSLAIYLIGSIKSSLFAFWTGLYRPSRQAGKRNGSRASFRRVATLTVSRRDGCMACMIVSNDTLTHRANFTPPMQSSLLCIARRARCKAGVSSCHGHVDIVKIAEFWLECGRAARAKRFFSQN